MLRNIKIINNDKGNVKHYTKLKILIVLLLLLLITIIFNSCGSKKIDIHEKDTIVIYDYSVQYFQIPETYALEVLTSNVEGIISRWIAQGGQESTEELTDIILKVSKFEECT